MSESESIEGYEAYRHDVLESTNDTIKHMAKTGAQHKTVVIAKRQTGGKGRRGNDWVSPPGNLYLSILWRGAVKTQDAGQISFLAAVALAEAAAAFLDRGDLRLKWPNDVLLDRRKLAGILLESESGGDALDWLVIGIGVNLTAAPEDAAKLEDFSAQDITVEMFLPALLRALNDNFALWQEKGFMPIREKWLSRACGIGGQVRVRLPHETLNGVFESIDTQGCLILNRDGERQKIASGDVFFG